MKHWIDNADSYICPVCGFETDNPNRYTDATCPICSFQDLKDLKRSMTNDRKLVDKIASFFEKEENWRALKNCWLENDRSDDLRNLLYKALKE